MIITIIISLLINTLLFIIIMVINKDKSIPQFLVTKALESY